MLFDVYNRNPRTISKLIAGFTGAAIGFGVAGLLSKKRPKLLISLGLISGLIARMIYVKNQPVGIAGDPEDVITWLKLEGFTNIPEKFIKETGYCFWK